MQNALFIGLSKQVALRTQMDVVANNVANMNTAGFRGQNMMFREVLEDPRGQEHELSYVVDFGQYDNTDPGPIQFTGDMLDVALEGPGFLGVNKDGETLYTRAGDFKTDATGVLVTPSGYPVASEGGGDLVIPPGTESVKITDQGLVVAISPDGNQEVGRLMLAEFANPQNLRPVGDVLYRTPDAPLPAERTVVKQGVLEGSNVNSIIEITNMIEVLREYQAVQSFIGDEDERQRTAVREMLRTS